MLSEDALGWYGWDGEEKRSLLMTLLASHRLWVIWWDLTPCLTLAFQRRAGKAMETQRFKSSVQDAQPLSALRLGASFSGTAQFICLFMVHPVVMSILGPKGAGVASGGEKEGRGKTSQRKLGLAKQWKSGWSWIKSQWSSYSLGTGEWQVPSLCLVSLREEVWEAARLLAA